MEGITVLLTGLVLASLSLVWVGQNKIVAFSSFPPTAAEWELEDYRITDQLSAQETIRLEAKVADIL